MPQMSPLNWMCMLFYFWSLLILMITINYFIQNNISNNTLKNSFKMTTYNWKW